MNVLQDGRFALRSLRALPCPQAGQPVRVRELADEGHTMALAYPNYVDLAASVGQFGAARVAR